MFGACAVLFFIAMLYEGLKLGRDLMLRNAVNNEKLNNHG